jgi:photosynthetic reaction center H subunit
MEFGAITGYVDLAQILLYAFWLFFAGLIYYLVREGHREGYPMESDSLGRAVIKGWPIPEPKTFKLADGRSVTVPELHRPEPDYSAVSTGPSPGSPIEPKGDPMLSGTGPGAWSNRADTPDVDLHGHPRIVPLRALPAFSVSSNDVDPRGLPVVAGDGKTAGTIGDLWVDHMEMMFRYMEVKTAGGKTVLLPMQFARVRRNQIEVDAIYAHHFAHVPTLRNPDQITLLEEEKITAFYGGGTLYADPKRGEPLI